MTNQLKAVFRQAFTYRPMLLLLFLRFSKFKNITFYVFCFVSYVLSNYAFTYSLALTDINLINNNDLTTH